MKIKFSIIIAVYNDVDLISKSIESVLNQSSKCYELIIIDGGSTDGTLNILKSYEKEFSYWISEKDNGIYDAWNKGIQKVSSSWVMFIGADDFLIPDALESYQNYLLNLDNNTNLEYLSSRVMTQDLSGNPIRVIGWPWNWPLMLRDMLVAHPGSLHSIHLFEKYGNFDTTYKISGDYELLLRPGKNLNAAFMDKITVIMSEGGVSDSIKAINEQYRAIVNTGRANKIFAYFNKLYIIIKFYTKKSFRYLGFNVYLRK